MPTYAPHVSTQRPNKSLDRASPADVPKVDHDPLFVVRPASNADSDPRRHEAPLGSRLGNLLLGHLKSVQGQMGTRPSDRPESWKGAQRHRIGPPRTAKRRHGPTSAEVARARTRTAARAHRARRVPSCDKHAAQAPRDRAEPGREIQKRHAWLESHGRHCIVAPHGRCGVDPRPMWGRFQVDSGVSLGRLGVDKWRTVRVESASMRNRFKVELGSVFASRSTRGGPGITPGSTRIDSGPSWRRIEVE